MLMVTYTDSIRKLLSEALSDREISVGPEGKVGKFQRTRFVISSAR